MNTSFTDPRSELRFSVRATMDTSLDLLGDDTSREAFMSCGTLPTNKKVPVAALAKLWRPQLNQPSGALTLTAEEGDRGNALPSARVEDLVDVLVCAGLMRRVVHAAVGCVSVELHPVAGEYARALLGERCRETVAQ